jgi:hypothetical protein
MREELRASCHDKHSNRVMAIRLFVASGQPKSPCSLNPNLQVAYVGLEAVADKQAHHLRLSMLPADPAWTQAEDGK